MEQAMLDEVGVADTFCGESSQTVVYLANIVLCRPNSDKNTYDHFKVF